MDPEEYTKAIQSQVLEIFNKVKEELGLEVEAQLINKENKDDIEDE